MYLPIITLFIYLTIVENILWSHMQENIQVIGIELGGFVNYLYYTSYDI